MLASSVQAVNVVACNAEALRVYTLVLFHYNKRCIIRHDTYVAQYLGGIIMSMTSKMYT